MLKSKDLLKKNVYDSSGKKLGRVKDIVIDFINGKIDGVIICNSKSKEKVSYINIEDVGYVIRGNKSAKCEGILFSNLKNMQIIDTMGKEKGVIDDFIVTEDNFEIKGFILNEGKIENLLKGNEIILIKDIILEDGYLLYFGESNIILKNIPHEINNLKHSRRA